MKGSSRHKSSMKHKSSKSSKSKKLRKKRKKNAKKWKKIMAAYFARCRALIASHKVKKPHSPVVPKHVIFLKRLVRKKKLNYLIINLNSCKRGYSISIKARHRVFSIDSIHIPYESSELLNYIDNEEFPPLFLLIAHKLKVRLFYHGCCITEIRDYQGSIPPPGQLGAFYSTHYVLLRPSAQSVICDVEMITNEFWRRDQADTLEAKLLLSTSEPLCLTPNKAVTVLANIRQQRKHRLSRFCLKKLALKHSPAYARRRRKSIKYTGVSFHRYLSMLHYNKKAQWQRKFPTPDRRIIKNMLPIYDNLQPSIEPALKLRAGVQIRRTRFAFTCKPVKVEEFIYEFEGKYQQFFYNELTVCLQPHDEQYFGLLHVFLGEPVDGSEGFFNIGNRISLDRYISQLTEILSEDGSRYLRTTRSTPTTPHKTIFTYGYKKTPQGDAILDTKDYYRKPKESDLEKALYARELAYEHDYSKEHTNATCRKIETSKSCPIKRNQVTECCCSKRDIKVAMKRSYLILKSTGHCTKILTKRLTDIERQEQVALCPYPQGTTLGKVACTPWTSIDSGFIVTGLNEPPHPILRESGLVTLPRKLVYKDVKELNAAEARKSRFGPRNRYGRWIVAHGPGMTQISLIQTSFSSDDSDSS